MKKAIIPIVIIVVLIGIYMVANMEQGDETERPKVELVYVEWSTEVASTNVVKAVLQEVMGYDAEITPVSAAAMWQAVGSGDRDGMVAAWLPTTHADYLAKNEAGVTDLGANLVGTRIGLVVPDYVQAQSIEDLKVYADRFDSKIIGIDPGAGIMKKTQQAIKEYGLEDYTLVEGTGATMIGALEAAIRKEEPVVITGWTPHWKFSRWDLRYLQDPKNVYGGEEEIHTVVRKGLPQEMPEVATFLDQFEWTPEQMQQLMNWNQTNPNPYANAKKWIKMHPELVSEWVQGTGFADEVDEKLAAIEAPDAIELDDEADAAAEEENVEPETVE